MRSPGHMHDASAVHRVGNVGADRHHVRHVFVAHEHERRAKDLTDPLVDRRVELLLFGAGLLRVLLELVGAEHHRAHGRPQVRVDAAGERRGPSTHRRRLASAAAAKSPRSTAAFSSGQPARVSSDHSQPGRPGDQDETLHELRPEHRQLESHPPAVRAADHSSSGVEQRLDISRTCENRTGSSGCCPNPRRSGASTRWPAAQSTSTCGSHVRLSAIPA